MKSASIIRTALLGSALTATFAPARADINIDNNAYSANGVFTSADGNNIVSYDYDSSNTLYYETATPFNFNYGGFYVGSSTTPVAAGSSSSSDYAGASVVTIGRNVYFNNTDGITFDNNIYAYSIAGGTASFVSDTTNFGLYKGQDGSLFITGSPGGANYIYNTALNPDGSFVSNPATDLGADSGASGPLAFNSSGNLYYAPGFGDQSIYEWTAAQLAAALANPTGNPLSVGEALKTTYSAPSEGGGTSMLISGSELLLTLTEFDGPSELVAFGLNPDGTIAGGPSEILDDAGTTGSSLGELRMDNGDLLLSDGDQIFAISVPEPSTMFLMVLGFGGLIWFRARRARKLVPAAALTLSAFFFR